MPSRVLVHFPEPATPKVVDRSPPDRPAIGEEFLPGWKACDYNLVRGTWEGEEYRYEVWVMPVSSDSC
jgi:hypothetical protein